VHLSYATAFPTERAVTSHLLRNMFAERHMSSELGEDVSVEENIKPGIGV
jgi:hypothetical protein